MAACLWRQKYTSKKKLRPFTVKFMRWVTWEILPSFLAFLWRLFLNRNLRLQRPKCWKSRLAAVVGSRTLMHTSGRGRLPSRRLPCAHVNKRAASERARCISEPLWDMKVCFQSDTFAVRNAFYASPATLMSKNALSKLPRTVFTMIICFCLSYWWAAVIFD